MIPVFYFLARSILWYNKRFLALYFEKTFAKFKYFLEIKDFLKVCSPKVKISLQTISKLF